MKLPPVKVIMSGVLEDNYKPHRASVACGSALDSLHPIGGPRECRCIHRLRLFTAAGAADVPEQIVHAKLQSMVKRGSHRQRVGQ